MSHIMLKFFSTSSPRLISCWNHSSYICTIKLLTTTLQYHSFHFLYGEQFSFVVTWMLLLISEKMLSV